MGRDSLRGRLFRAVRGLQKSHRLEADMAFAADHQMIVQCDFQGLGGVCDFACHRDVGLAGCRIAGRMVVQQALQYSKPLVLI